MAVKVTLVPEHIVVDDADTETLAVTLGFTVILTVFELAGLPDTQEAVEVITQYTLLPFVNAELE